MTDFHFSKAGQHASLAKQFLEAALTLSDAQHQKGRILFRPTLSLAGHGLELMLKASCYLNDFCPSTSGRKGHDVLGLWGMEVCQQVRVHIYTYAHQVAAAERLVNAYSDVPRDEEVAPLIEEYVLELGKLHGLRGHPLRYPYDVSQKAPRTPFLVKSLWGAADAFVKRPSSFMLNQSRD